MTDNERQFYLDVKEKYPESFKNRRVFEGGSLDHNGTTRTYFEFCDYIGVDWRAGKSVDVVSLIHEYRDKPDGYFDTVISGATLEHDAYWKQSLKRMIELLKVGGDMVLCWAIQGFGRHCMEAASAENYYRELSVEEVLKEISQYAQFEMIDVFDKKNYGNRNLGFLYFGGKK